MCLVKCTLVLMILMIMMMTVKFENRTLMRKEMFYEAMYSTYFIYGYMASDIW